MNLSDEYEIHPYFQEIFELQDESFWQDIINFFKPSISAPANNDTLQVQQLIHAGNHDENNLTNLIFFKHHPERNGKKIDPAETNFNALRDEWISVRNNIVRPNLAPAKSNTRGNREIDQFVARMKPYLAYINTKRGIFPLAFVLGWIKVESGGHYGDEATSHISLNERGFFQVSKDESKSIHADHLRITSDPYYSIDAGMELLKHYAGVVKSQGFSDSDEVFLKLVKFCHAAGTGSFSGVVKKMKQANQMTRTWDQFKAFVFNPANRIFDINRLLQNPKRFTDNVDKVFNYGEQIVKAIDHI